MNNLLLCLEVDIFCLCCLGCLFYTSRSNYESNIYLFFRITMRVAVLVILDLLSRALRIYATYNEVSPYVTLLVVTLFLFWVVYMGYSLFLDECIIFFPQRIPNILSFLMFSLPFWFITCMIFTSFSHGRIVYIGVENRIYLGESFWTVLVVYIVYQVLSLIDPLTTIDATRVQGQVPVHLYYILGLGTVPMLGMYWEFQVEYPVAVPVYTLTLFYIFITMQHRGISLDGLTKLNNRGELNLYLNRFFSSHNQSKRQKLCLMFIDINGFKQINDTYGHAEGDRALIYIAGGIRDFCENHECFAGRYGGDEFVLVFQNAQGEEMKRNQQELEQLMQKIAHASKLPYKLSISVGYVFYRPEFKDVKSFITAADEYMYRNKQRYYSQPAG
ncbi:MAG: GGDEF domain-containing protein [Succinivibrio sp.]|nr:GGDEF domain-containing protein [Succinivibrio sp.]